MKEGNKDFAKTAKRQMQGRGAPHSLVSVMRLPFVITTILINDCGNCPFFVAGVRKNHRYRTPGNTSLAPWPCGRGVFIPLPSFLPALKAVDVFKPVGFAVGPQGVKNQIDPFPVSEATPHTPPPAAEQRPTPASKATPHTPPPAAEQRPTPASKATPSRRAAGEK